MNYNENQITKDLLNELEFDYIPLNDIVREIAGFTFEVPTSDIIDESMRFLERFIDKNSIKILFSDRDKMNLSHMSTAELIKFIVDKYSSNQWNDINYSIWFDK